ncbi:MAG: carboxypeptidase-like regulatory domain-containing protein [Bacteroidales bacterium]|nr:carboxypeptidase-like regulatory domain-containing protein [Bacteroidales bacterium]
MINKERNIINTMILLVGIMVFVFRPLQLFSQTNSILDSVITYKTRGISLYEGLNEIGDIVGYEFSYNSDLIASRNEIKVNYEEVLLRNLLSNLLNDITLTFYIVDKQIVICKKNLINKLTFKNGIIDSKRFLQIIGRIYDKESGESLAFANISLLGKSVGTVSNDHGVFNLKISHNNLLDTLAVSYIGYKNTYIPISQLSFYNNKIYLEEDHFQIQEVIIRSNNAEIILEHAIDKIKDNYYTGPYHITSFYREIVTNKNELASITEAVLEVYKSPYLGLFSDQIKLLKKRKNEYFSQADTVSLKLKGGLYASLYLDLIKNPSYFLIEEYFHNFNYNLTEIVNFDNSSAYVINFKPKFYLEDNSFEGNIYINTDNLAIVAVEFNITAEAIEKLGSSLIVKKAFGTRVKPTVAKYLINYRKINNKYFINLARGELEFKVKYKRKLFSTDFKTVFEFAANNIDTIDVKRFDRVETISSHNVFINETHQYDHQFWGEYNYISPDETLEEALVRIKRKLEEIEKD